MPAVMANGLIASAVWQYDRYGREKIYLKVADVVCVVIDLLNGRWLSSRVREAPPLHRR